MKKLITGMAVLVALMSSLRSTHAQETSIGPMIGLNASTIDGMPYHTGKPGLNLGFFLNHSNHERLGIKAEAMYSQMGTLFNGFSQKVEMHYIQVPLYGVFYFNERGNDIRPKLMIGPYLGFLAGVNGNDTSGNVFITESFKTLDVGAKAALGLNWRLGSGVWLNTEMYYGGSFTNIYQTDVINIKNRNFGINSGFSFPLN